MMSEPARRLLIRADAAAAIGSGHVMRCLALGETWMQMGGQVTLRSHRLPAGLANRVQQRGIELQALAEVPGSDADATRTAQDACGADWIVVDGYHFGDAFRGRAKDSGVRLLSIDDCGDVSIGDILLNQNLHADASFYPAAHDGRPLVLLGGRYALLRSEFTRHCGLGRDTPARARRVLVTCGGSDPSNLTAKVLEGLSHLREDDLEVTAIVGSGNPRFAQLRELASTGSPPIRLEHDPQNMADWMAWADVAITAAGSTCWEMACMGLPALVIVTAENQVPVAESMESYGIGRSLGWGHVLTCETIAEAFCSLSRDAGARARMSGRGPELIDGQGCDRVAQLLVDPELKLRRAGWSDCRLLWEWRNEPYVRSVSFSTDEIPWDAHSAWFAERLRAEDCEIWIAEDAAGSPVGQVRFEIDGDRAEVSITLDKQHRGMGRGTALIRAATETMLGSRRVVHIDAFIRHDNLASRRAFEKAGYKRCPHEPESNRGLRYIASRGSSVLPQSYRRTA